MWSTGASRRCKPVFQMIIKSLRQLYASSTSDCCAPYEYVLSLCDALCISNSCFTKHARGNRSLALSNISRSLQRFLMVHTKQHRFVESFKRSDIQLRIISIHCDVLPKNVCLAFWQKWKQNGSRNTMLLHWSDYSYYGKP